MSFEDQIRGRLRADAAGYQPIAEPGPRVLWRVAARRRGRVRRRVAAVTGSVVCVGGLLIPLLLASSGPRHQKVDVEPSVSLPPVESDELISVDAARLTIRSLDGQVLSTVALSPSLPGPPAGTVAVSAATDAAYVVVATDVSCRSAELIAIDLRSGHDTSLVGGVRSPTVSPDGEQLAYITNSGPSCQWDEVAVRNLTAATTATTTWKALPPSTGPGTPAPALVSVAWAPDGRRLAVGSIDGQGSGIGVLDTATPATTDNPRQLPGQSAQLGWHYAYPAFATDGTITALAPYCWGTYSCPHNPHPRSEIVALNPDTGAVAATIVDKADGLEGSPSGLLVDSSGRLVAVVSTPPSGADNVYRVADGRLQLLTTGVQAIGVMPVAPIAPGPTQPPSPSTTIVGGDVIRYWGPITAPYIEPGTGTQLAVPPSGTKPTVPWQRAASPCGAGTTSCGGGPRWSSEDVFLAVGTYTQGGGGPMFDTLVYVIATTEPCVSVSPAPVSTVPRVPTTSRPQPSCLGLQFVNANTGASLGGEEGPALQLPPHS